MKYTSLASPALGCALVLSGCGNDNNTSLSTQEQAALIQALSTSGVIGGPETILALSPLLAESDVGTVGNYAAVGGMIKYTMQLNGVTQANDVSAGILGWTGLNTGSKTVSSAISASAFEEDATTFPATLNEDIASGNGEASYWDGTNLFVANSGVFKMTGATFGGSSNCPNIPPASGGVEITECRFATGSMQGNFDFVASHSGSPDFTQANTTYDVPAVQLSVTVNFTGAAARAAVSRAQHHQ